MSKRKAPEPTTRATRRSTRAAAAAAAGDESDADDDGATDAKGAAAAAVAVGGVAEDAHWCTPEGAAFVVTPKGGVWSRATAAAVAALCSSKAFALLRGAEALDRGVCATGGLVWPDAVAVCSSVPGTRCRDTTVHVRYQDSGRGKLKPIPEPVAGAERTAPDAAADTANQLFKPREKSIAPPAFGVHARGGMTDGQVRALARAFKAAGHAVSEVQSKFNELLVLRRYGNATGAVPDGADDDALERYNDAARLHYYNPHSAAPEPAAANKAAAKAAAAPKATAKAKAEAEAEPEPEAEPEAEAEAAPNRKAAAKAKGKSKRARK